MSINDQVRSGPDWWISVGSGSSDSVDGTGLSVNIAVQVLNDAPNGVGTGLTEVTNFNNTDNTSLAVAVELAASDLVDGGGGGSSDGAEHSSVLVEASVKDDSCLSGTHHGNGLVPNGVGVVGGGISLDLDLSDGGVGVSEHVIEQAVNSV